MPKQQRITRESIIDAALAIVRKDGGSSLNARSVASSLQCSTQPIFSNFASMEELKQSVIDRALEIYEGYINDEISAAKYPPYKASGMGYIRFASHEHELFKLLYMRDRRGEDTAKADEYFKSSVSALEDKMNFTHSAAERMHAEMWIFVHGIATMAATSYLEWDEETVSLMMSDVYSAMIAKIKGEEK